MIRRIFAGTFAVGALALAACTPGTQPTVPDDSGDSMMEDQNSSDAMMAPSTGGYAAAVAAANGATLAMSQENGSITFVGGSTLIDHTGEFTKFDVTITPDVTDPAAFEKSTVSVTIDITSVQTDSDGLTAHLQREDFFNAEMYPSATFVSSSIAPQSDGTYWIAGTMTIKGTSLPATFSTSLTDDGLVASYDLPRRDFNIGNDSYGEKLLDELVPVAVALSF